MPGLSDYLLGTNAYNQQLPTGTQGQQNLNQQSIQQLMQLLQSGQAKGFEPIANQARQQFNTQTIPSIAERFTSLGDNAQRSSAFTGALGQAGAGLESSLASLGSQYNQQQQRNLIPLATQPQFENLYHTAQPGALQSSIGPVLQLLMAYLSGGSSGGSSALGALGGLGGGQQQGGAMFGNRSGGFGGSGNYSNPALRSSNIQNLMGAF